MKLEVTEEFLNANPNAIFVFGDNLVRKGTGGAAKLRHHPQVYGFITKKTPAHDSNAYYTPEEYRPIFASELLLLERKIADETDKVFYISRIGAGLANRKGIFEAVIKDNYEFLATRYPNVVILEW